MDGQIFVGSDDGYIYSLNASSGSLEWKYQTEGAVRSSPAVTNERVVVGSDDGYVYALDRFYFLNGTPYLIWKYMAGLPLRYSSPVVTDGRVFIGGSIWEYVHFFCLSETTTNPDGELIWKYSLRADTPHPPDVVVTSPAVVGDRVFISLTEGWSGYTVISFDASTGSIIWSYHVDPGISWDISSVAVGYGKIFIGIGSVEGSDNSIFSLNATTGAFLWSYVSSSASRVLSSPALSEGKVFIGRSDGFHCLNQSTGALIWKYGLGTAKSSPAISDGKLFVGSDDGYIVAFGNSSSVTISTTPTEITLGGSTLISGKLTDTFSGVGLSGKIIDLEYSTDRGTTWDTMDSTTTASDGSYTYIWTPPTAGRYTTIRAIFRGDTSYNGATSLGYFIHVLRISSSITVSSDPPVITYECTTNIEGSLTDPNGTGIPDQTIYLEYTIDGLTYHLFASALTVSNGNYSFLWAPSAGSYTIRANFTGNVNYTEASSTTSFIVNKVSSTITVLIDPPSVACGNTTTINGTLLDQYGKELSAQSITLEYSKNEGLSWNTITSVTTLLDGSYSYPWGPQEIGSYLIRAKYAGTINHNPSDSTTSLTVIRGSSSTSTVLSATIITYGQGLTVTGVINRRVSDGTLTIQSSIDNVSWNAIRSGTPSNGTFSATWVPPYVGIFYIRALWSGDLNYAGSTSPSKTLTIGKASSTIACTLSSSTVPYGQGITIAGTISTATDGTVTLEHSIDGSTWVTIASGASSNSMYSSSWTPPEAVTFYLRAKWDGNINYHGATSAIHTLTITKASSSITCTLSPTSIMLDSSLTISEEISPAISEAPVTIYYRLKGLTTYNILVTTQTDDQGNYEYTWTPHSAGTYEITTTWTGNSNYDGAQSGISLLNVLSQEQMPDQELLDQLSQARTLQYIFLGTTIILALSTIFLALRRRTQNSKKK